MASTDSVNASLCSSYPVVFSLHTCTFTDWIWYQSWISSCVGSLIWHYPNKTFRVIVTVEYITLQ